MSVECLELPSASADGTQRNRCTYGSFGDPALQEGTPLHHHYSNPVNLVDARGFQAECGGAAPCGRPAPDIGPSSADGGTAGLLQDTLRRIADLIDLVQSNPLGGILGPAPPQERTLEGGAGGRGG